MTGIRNCALNFFFSQENATAVPDKTPLTTKVQSVEPPRPAPSNAAPLISLSSLSHSHVTVDQWLAGLEDGVELTPDVIPANKQLHKKRFDFTQKHTEKPLQSAETHVHQTLLTVPSSSSQNLAGHVTPVQTPRFARTKEPSRDTPRDIGTPQEPELSEFTMRILSMVPAAHKQDTKDTGNNPPVTTASVISTATPEEPQLSEFGCSRPKVTEEAKNVGTPEEPVLSHQVPAAGISEQESCTPEEPVLSYQCTSTAAAHSATSDTISDKPASSTQQPVIMATARGQRMHSSNPTLSAAHGRPVDQLAPKAGTPLRSIAEIPDTPELSEVTQSILSLTNRYGNSQSHHPRKDLYHTKSVHEQHAAHSQFSSSVYDDGSSRNDKPQQNGCENSRESRSQLRQDSKLCNEKQDGKLHPVIPMEQFFGVSDIPPSPELSDITQKIIGQIKR